MRIFLTALFIIFIFSGCSQKVKVESYQPAKIDRVSKSKKLSVLDFNNDTIAFASTLETKLANKKVYGKPYFNVISRSELDTILEEQRFQYSGLVDKDTAVKIGEMIGVSTLISGEVADASLKKNHYYNRRYKCLDKKCDKKRVYFIRCVEGNYNLSVNIKMTDVELGDIIYADTMSRSRSYSHCFDSSGGLPNKGKIFNLLSLNIIDDFISVISPTKISMQIELLDDPQIDYSDEQERLLENSLEYIKMGRYAKAEELLSELLNSTMDKCFVASYNLGVVKEILGKYEQAKQLYDLSESLVDKPNETVSYAVIRIGNKLNDKKVVQKQLEN